MLAQTKHRAPERVQLLLGSLFTHTVVLGGALAALIGGLVTLYGVWRGLAPSAGEVAIITVPFSVYLVLLSLKTFFASALNYDRRFRAVDVKTGKTLWMVRLGTTVQGYPISFSIDGKQYIAVTTGLGGGSPQDKPMTMLQSVHRPNNGQALYVFALSDRH